MSKKTLKNPKSKNIVEMQLVNPNAAGIDVGDTLHAVAVPNGRDTERVKTFGSMTCCLLAIVSWLKQCSIETVAMESTGVYWKPLFELLIQNGFEVYLVNAKQVRNVTGRKNDEDDAMWIQKLHSCGLLKSSFLPDDEQETLRTLVRYRKTLVQDCSRFILRMQKSMELMNIKLHTVISDITGQTGTAIVEAIIAGERKAENFLPFVGKGIKTDHDTIVKSLQGNWREEHLFTLAESYQFYKFYKERIASCDKQIEIQLQHYEASRNEGVIEKENVKEEAEKALVKKTNKISGGKLISSHLMKKKPNLASQAFRNAANAVQKSEHWIGDYFRRMKTKGGNKYAVIATAAKIATIYYKMVRYKQEFNPIDLEQYQQKYKQAKIKYLERKLNELKIQVA